jgi:hypothetical protein
VKCITGIQTFGENVALIRHDVFGARLPFDGLKENGS